MPDAAFDAFILAEGKRLRAGDEPSRTKAAWTARRAALLDAVRAAMGPFPEKPCPLEAKALGVLKRPGYQIEKLVFQSRPDVWVTANAYVPQPAPKKKLPAVLVVHGHWAGARRDPVVQARCLGLMHLGFFVLAVDAFGSGERYTHPAKGTYHGALYGSTLWPVGQTLLGMQVYDNRRAVDYLRSREEVAGDRIGITGASGGGNQSMYAGATDDRLRAIVPVCSVGTYQAYLKAACCVCEVLPGALRFTEEGDVLGLVAPRALMVINASRDAYQFSPGEAEKSVARAKAVYAVLGEGEKLRHQVFASGHDYNQAMREAMYGWMTRWLKDEGEAKPIPEPKHTIETPEDLACYPDGKRPAGFLFPPGFAAREAKGLLAKPALATPPDHAEDWESTATFLRGQLRKALGEMPKLPRPNAKLDKPVTEKEVATTPVELASEPGLKLAVDLRGKAGLKEKQPLAVLLHLDGKKSALEHPLADALVRAGWLLAAPELRASGGKPGAGTRGAPDHNDAEHALWIGRPLLGQWTFDVFCLLDWLAIQPGIDPRRVAVVGLGQAGTPALVAAALAEERVTIAATVEGPVSYVTDSAYGPGTRMGLLVPGILRVGDVPHLAALAAPRRLVVVDGRSPQGVRLTDKQLDAAFAFTRGVYKASRAEKRFTLATETPAADLAGLLG